MTTLRIVSLLATLACGSVVIALEPVSVVLEQPHAPVEIFSYITEYRTTPEAPKEGIWHDVAWGNSSDRKIVAIKVGLVSLGPLLASGLENHRTTVCLSGQTTAPLKTFTDLPDCI